MTRRPGWCRAALVLALAVAGAARADDFYLLESYYRLGRLPKALEAIERIERGEPGTLPPNVMLIKANCLAGTDKPAEAIATLEDLIARFPDSDAAEPARIKMIAILETQNNTPVLVAKLQTWAGLEAPGQNAYAQRLVDALVARNRRADAVAWLEKSTNPSHWEILFDLLRRGGDLDKELSRLQAAGEQTRNPRLVGTLLAQANRWTQARPYLEQAMRAAPADKDLGAWAATRAQEAGDNAAASGYLSALVDRFPDDAALLSKLGACVLNQGQKGKALAIFARIKNTGAKDLQSYQLYVKVLSEQNLLQEAVAGIVEARTQLRRQDLMAVEMAGLLVKLGRYGDAVGELSHVLSEAPEFAAAARSDTAQDRIRDIAKISPAAYSQVTAMLHTLTTQRPGDVALLRVADDVMAAHGDTAGREAMGRALARLLAGNVELLTDTARDMASEDRGPLARAMIEEVLPHLPPPRSFEAQLELAELLEGDRPHEAARVALALDRPDVPGTFVQSARLLAARLDLGALKDPQAAKDVLTRLLVDPAPPDQLEQAHVLLARALTLLGDFAAARTHLDALASTSNRDVLRQCLWRRGLLDLYEGKIEAARESLGQMVLRAPDAPESAKAVEALYILALAPQPQKGAAGQVTNWAGALLRQRELLEAGQLERYKALAAGLDPAQIPPALKPQFALLTATALRAQNRPQEALTVLRALVTAAPESSVAQKATLLQADILGTDLHDQAGARSTLEDFLVHYPASLQGDAVRKRLESVPSGGAMPSPSPTARPAPESHTP